MTAGGSYRRIYCVSCRCMNSCCTRTSNIYRTAQYIRIRIYNSQFSVPQFSPSSFSTFRGSLSFDGIRALKRALLRIDSTMAKHTSHAAATSAANQNQGTGATQNVQMQNQNQYQDPSQNPYFLHPNESPNQVLVSCIFTGSNYHTWARSMKRALISKNKFKFVNGMISKPDEFHPLIDAWEKCNNMVHH